MEGDLAKLAHGCFVINFYPRPPGGGRPSLIFGRTKTQAISIHALRVEGDMSVGPFRACRDYFYPRPPGGGRREDYAGNFGQAMISIHALRVEGDLCQLTGSHSIGISIHALRVEGDAVCFSAMWFCCQISIHALRVEGDDIIKRAGIEVI